MMLEIPGLYYSWNDHSRTDFVKTIIHHYTNKLAFVGYGSGE